VTASKSRQIVLDSGCSASTTNDESHFVGPFSKIARTLRFLVGSVVASAEGHVQVITRGGPLRWPAICVRDSPFELLSTSYLASQGLDCLFTDAGASVFERDSGHVVATASLRNGLYFLDVLDEEVHLASTSPLPPRHVPRNLLHDASLPYVRRPPPRYKFGTIVSAAFPIVSSRAWRGTRLLPVCRLLQSIQTSSTASLASKAR